MQKKPVKKGKIIPIGDRVLVKPFTAEELKGKKPSYGIILPDAVVNEKSAHGKVVAVGEGKKVKAGDVDFFSKYSYDEIELDGEEFYLIKEGNVLAVIK